MVRRIGRSLSALSADVARSRFLEILTSPPSSVGVEIFWLGQAGFLLRDASTSIVIDPYLSDSLAVKYRGREFPHKRMMPVPVDPSLLHGVDVVLATHGHTDHLDPGTLPGILAANPHARLVVPRAHLALAEERGVPSARAIPIDAGEAIRIGRSEGVRQSRAGVRISAVPAAHERLDRDADGNHLYLGYVIEFADATLYHSGDCVPFDGLVEMLKPHRVDVALLPINGRDPERTASGIPGNFTLQEALRLASMAGVPYIVGHHWGMFAFNTIDPQTVFSGLEAESRGIVTCLPEIGVGLTVDRGSHQP